MSERRAFLIGVLLSSFAGAACGPGPRPPHAVERVPPLPNAERAAEAKHALLDLAVRYGGEGDPGGARQRELEGALADLVRSAPPAPLAERQRLIVGSWRQIFGPMDYRGHERGLDPALRANEIYQVVFEGGFYYNVTPLYEEAERPAKIALLRGEYVLDPNERDVFRVRFVRYPGVRGGLPEGIRLVDLPALAEADRLPNATTIVPTWIVRTFFGGGALEEVYTDDSLRVVYGSNGTDYADRYLYVMTRVGERPPAPASPRP